MQNKHKACMKILLCITKMTFISSTLHFTANEQQTVSNMEHISFSVHFQYGYITCGISFDSSLSASSLFFFVCFILWYFQRKCSFDIVIPMDHVSSLAISKRSVCKTFSFGHTVYLENSYEQLNS